MKKVYIILVLLITVGWSRLVKTYVDQQQELFLYYSGHHFAKALEIADKFVIEVSKKYPQDTFIALLERGKIALDAKQHKTAINDLSQAEKRFLDIEGTISLSEETSSLFLDGTT